jgi:uncharacterized protein
MHKLVFDKVTTTAVITDNMTKRNVPSTPVNKENADREVVKACPSVCRPFHLSMCVKDLESTRNFYKNILGLEERRATTSSVHFDFYGCQLTFHEIPGYNAKNIQREVDAEDVPVPHFGAALTFEEFERTKESLIAHGVKFLKTPRLRFIGKGHEQHVMFLEDPSGHGIELKSFTKVPVGNWA